MRLYKEGITLISIAIIIAVLLVLSTVATFSVNGIIQNTLKKDFISEYNLVKAATSDYVMRNSGIIDFTETEISLTNVSSEHLSQFKEDDIQSNQIDGYIIDLEKVGVYNASYGIQKGGDANDVYVLSKNTGTIYYKKGFQNKDNTYYRPEEY